jgi:chloramphenicol-sensitive protein RarD
MKLTGLILLISAYLLWCFFPLYFKQMAAIPALDIMAFRTFFTFVSILPIAVLCGKWKTLVSNLCSPQRVGTLFISGLLVSANWFIFIVLVNTSHTIQASLGYYINPLLTVLFALLFFGERFGKLQWTSLGVAVIGVTIFAVGAGVLPWGALCVATTFALYGVMKKTCQVDSLTSLTVETMLLSPFVIAYILWTDAAATVWQIDPYQFFWLLGCGGITSFTLILYSAGARRCKLSTLGFCQYITPTGQFLTAVLIFKEPMPTAQWFCFGLIWISLALFTIDSLREDKNRQGTYANNQERDTVR